MSTPIFEVEGAVIAADAQSTTQNTTITLEERLLDAIVTGAVREVAALVAQGADISFVLPGGRTPLLATVDHAPMNNDENPAVEHPVISILQILLNAGADINHQDESGYTALLIAIDKGHRKRPVAKFLITAGADVNLTEEYSVSPLMMAIEMSSVELIPLLIEKGALLTHKSNDREQDSALMRLISSCNDPGAKVENRLPYIETLLKLGADPNQRNRGGQNALHKAICTPQKFRTILIPLLLHHGANRYEVTVHGSSPIHFAYRYGGHNKYSAVLPLMENIDLTIPVNKEGDTAFTFAAKYGFTDILQNLYERGIEKNELQKTFFRLGECNGSGLKTIFGHRPHTYYLINEDHAFTLNTVRWFLKYVNTADLITLCLQKAQYISATDDVSRFFPNEDNDFNANSRVNKNIIKLQQEILSLLLEEYISRLEIGTLNSEQYNPKNEVFLQPKQLKHIAELVATSIEMPKDKCYKFSAKRMVPWLGTQARLFPYLQLATRSGNQKESFVFSNLSDSLKARIIDFLEVRPLYQTQTPAYNALLRRRITWVQEKVHEEERQKIKAVV